MTGASEGLGQADGLDQRPQLAIALFQFIPLIALGHNARACLEPQFASLTEECTDNDSLIEFPVKSDEANTTSINTAAMRLQLTDNLQGSHLRSATQCASGKSPLTLLTRWMT